MLLSTPTTYTYYRRHQCASSRIGCVGLRHRGQRYQCPKPEKKLMESIVCNPARRTHCDVGAVPSACTTHCKLHSAALECLARTTQCDIRMQCLRRNCHCTVPHAVPATTGLHSATLGGSCTYCGLGSVGSLVCTALGVQLHSATFGASYYQDCRVRTSDVIVILVFAMLG